ncbi:hypothetical protein BVC71_02290 [Marivivens niveibacter]|uniref:Uncharacterized protein n=1 Tax=Marivivens niveibacter TaxID=1930667 RepID=A0A251X188_9RHOB|nr:sulfotransferase [Marivivens niveibacter]OUD10356.1 hypothetical protein BVC71_02290 [Marivivens niveibacter]
MANAIKDAAKLEQSGDITGAEKLLRQLVQKDPKSPPALTAITEFYLRRPGGARFASAFAKQLVANTNKSSKALILAAQVEAEQNQLQTAVKLAEKAHKLDRKNTEIQYIYAVILRKSGDEAAARPLLDAVIKSKPNHKFARRELGRLLVNTGDLDGATKIAEDLAKDFPNDLSGLSLYSTANKITADNPIYVDAKERLLPLLQKTDRLTFARGARLVSKIETDLGNHDDAFKLVHMAKAAAPARFDEKRYVHFVQSQTQNLTRADFFGATGSNDETPVFIVGMPRSGSTLLEQVLTAHPQIGGIGESLAMNDISSRLKLGIYDGKRMVDVIRGINSETSARAAGDYLTHMKSRLPDGALRGVDKFLHNFERLGLIAKLFPKARVIHAVRDPMDTCTSCYMSPLSGNHGYTQSLDQLGRYYKYHLGLMQHWKSVLPLQIATVRYEDMVNDLETTAKSTISALSLDWDEACLNYQNNDNAARTISTWQVRQPIYSSSIGRWKRYDQFLGPLKKELASLYKS